MDLGSRSACPQGHACGSAPCVCEDHEGRTPSCLGQHCQSGALESSWEPLRSPSPQTPHSRWGTGSYRWSCSGSAAGRCSPWRRGLTCLEFPGSCPSGPAFQPPASGLWSLPAKCPNLRLTAISRNLKVPNFRAKAISYHSSPNLTLSMSAERSHRAMERVRAGPRAQSTASGCPHTFLPSWPPFLPHELGIGCSHFLPLCQSPRCLSQFPPMFHPLSITHMQTEIQCHFFPIPRCIHFCGHCMMLTVGPWAHQGPSTESPHSQHSGLHLKPEQSTRIRRNT